MTQPEAIAEVTRRLIGHYQPDRIYLFGSSARGEAGPDSDLDFCVVLPDDAPPALLRPGSFYRSLMDIPRAVDVFRLRAAEFHRRRHWIASIPAAALREGRLLYDRSAPTN